MLNILTYTICFLLVAIGLCDLIHFICMLFFKPPVKSVKYILSYLDGKNDYLILKEQFEKYRWYGTDYANKIVAVYDELPDNNIVKEYSGMGIIFISRDKLPLDFLKTEL